MNNCFLLTILNQHVFDHVHEFRCKHQQSLHLSIHKSLATLYHSFYFSHQYFTIKSSEYRIVDIECLSMLIVLIPVFKWLYFSRVQKVTCTSSMLNRACPNYDSEEYMWRKVSPCYCQLHKHLRNVTNTIILSKALSLRQAYFYLVFEKRIKPGKTTILVWRPWLRQGDLTERSDISYVGRRD